MVSTFLKSIQS